MDSSSQQDEKIYEVGVIGAGVAGLTSAQNLISNGLTDVIVLEGNSRIGGRLWTYPLPKLNNSNEYVYVDLGGAWIHGAKGNPVYEFLESHGVELLSDNEMDTPIVGNGGIIYNDTKEYRKARKSFLKFIKYTHSLKGTKEYYELSMEELFKSVFKKRKNSLHYKLLDLCKTSWEAYNGASFCDLSVWDDDVVCPGGDTIIRGGYKVLIDILAQNLNIKLNYFVKEIDYSNPNYIELKSQNDEVIKVRKCILSLPLGVLQSNDVKFCPPLPLWKQKSIQAMGMGLMDKVILQFPKCFWNPNRRAYKYVRDDHSQLCMIYNLYPSTGEPILVFLYAADTAELLINESDDVVIEKALTTLKNIFGNRVMKPVRAIRTNWKNNIYSRGSYSYSKVGSKPSDVANLALPVDDKLFFCGEHTISEYLGCVHSAFLSGKRASEEVLISLKGGQFLKLKKRDNFI